MNCECIRAYCSSPVSCQASRVAISVSLWGYQNFMSCQYSWTGFPSTPTK